MLALFRRPAQPIPTYTPAVDSARPGDTWLNWPYPKNESFSFSAYKSIHKELGDYSQIMDSITPGNDSPNFISHTKLTSWILVLNSITGGFLSVRPEAETSFPLPIHPSAEFCGCHLPTLGGLSSPHPHHQFPGPTNLHPGHFHSYWVKSLPTNAP